VQGWTNAQIGQKLTETTTNNYLSEMRDLYYGGSPHI